MSLYLRFFSLLFLLLAGCAPQQKHVRKDIIQPFFHPLPAVFQASSEAEQNSSTSFELVLRPDGLYFLQMRNNISDDTPIQNEIGAWKYNQEKNTVRLLSYNKAVRVLAITEKQTLKPIKISGGTMPPLEQYDFILRQKKPGYEGVVHMQGMYSRKRGRGIFRECLSGASFPIVGLKRESMADVEQAYQDTLHGRSESLFVRLDVRLSARAGRGDRLVSLRPVGIDPYSSCGTKQQAVSNIPSIANSRWYLTEVDGKKIAPESVTRIPFLKVQGGEQLIQGFSGCNNFTGTWLFAYNNFAFNRLTATRMACPVGMQVEDAFLGALDSTRKYTIKNNVLNLHNRKGRVLARLHYSRKLTDLDF